MILRGGAIQVPIIDLGTQQWTLDTQPLVYAYNDAGTPPDYGLTEFCSWAIVIRMLGWIMMQLYAPVIAQTIQTGSISGSGIIDLGQPLSDVFFVLAGPIPASVNQWYGNPAIGKLGRFAWSSNYSGVQFMHEMKFFNFANMNFSADPNISPTGFFYDLPDGVTYNYQCQGLFGSGTVGINAQSAAGGVYSYNPTSPIDDALPDYSG